MFNKKIFGQNVRKLREQKGLTREELAEKCDVVPAYLYNIELGNNTPTIPVIYNLVKNLNSTYTALNNVDNNGVVQSVLAKASKLKTKEINLLINIAKNFEEL